MIRNRIHHWTCSKFADLLRGEDKPAGLTWQGWQEWRKEQQSKRPFRYWLAETGLRKLQNIVMFPYDIYREIKYYIRNRWVDKTHYLKTGLKPGNYYEFETRILHGLFNELVDFVETEYASLAKWSADKENKKYKSPAEAGLDYLNWSCGLKFDEDYGVDKKDKKYGQLTPQALVAEKTKNLYLWWKEIRPNRPDPMKAAELNWDKKEDDVMSGKVTADERKKFSKLEKIEESYNKEDTKMLIELIKIRQSLWT